MLSGSLSVVAAWAVWPAHFFPSYLVGYLFWLGISLGCVGLTMLHHLVGGSWGLVIRRPLESGAMNVLPLALLFLPHRLRRVDRFIRGRGRGRPDTRRSSNTARI